MARGRRSSRGVLAISSRLNEFAGKMSSASRGGPMLPRHAPVCSDSVRANGRKRPVKSGIDLSGVVNPELGLGDDWGWGLLTEREAIAMDEDELVDVPKLEPVRRTDCWDGVRDTIDATRCQCFVCRRKRGRRKGFRQKRVAQRDLRDGFRFMLDDTDPNTIFESMMEER